MRAQAQETVEPVLAAAGIPIVYIDHHAETIENHSKTTRLLGQLFGKEKRAEEILSFYTDNMKIITDRIANAPNKSVVYMEVTSTGPSSYGNTYANNYMWGAMLVKASGDNMADGIVIDAKPVSAEVVLAKNPDYIIFTGSYTGLTVQHLFAWVIFPNEAETQNRNRSPGKRKKGVLDYVENIVLPEQ